MTSIPPALCYAFKATASERYLIRTIPKLGNLTGHRQVPDSQIVDTLGFHLNIQEISLYPYVLSKCCTESQDLTSHWVTLSIVNLNIAELTIRCIEEIHVE